MAGLSLAKLYKHYLQNQHLAKAFYALGMLICYSSRRFYVGSVALARRYSNPDTTNSMAKNALRTNTPNTLGAQEVAGGGQIISAITGTDI